jgi:signal peptidase
MKHYANILTLTVLAVIQIGYIFVPSGVINAVVTYNRLIPVFYAVILTVYIIFTGREKNPAPIGDSSAVSAMYAAMFILLLYLAAVFVTSVLFGGMTNRAVSGFARFADSVWIYAVPAAIGEVFRFKIVRSTFSSRALVNTVLVLILTFAHFNIMSRFETDRLFRDFFIFFIPALLMNGVLTYMAYRSPLKVLIILRCLFLFPLLSPAVPSVSVEVWASITCGMLFLAALIYHANMQTPEGGFTKAAGKFMKIKQSRASLLLLTGVTALFAAFFLRVFPLFPTVVITGSMEGAVDRGAVAFVEKVAAEDVTDKVNVGSIILFHSSARGSDREILHRVIEIRESQSSGTVYITQGDANPIPDREPVRPEQIIGIVENYIPYAGYPVVIIRS